MGIKKTLAREVKQNVVNTLTELRELHSNLYSISVSPFLFSLAIY